MVVLAVKMEIVKVVAVKTALAQIVENVKSNLKNYFPIQKVSFYLLQGLSVMEVQIGYKYVTLS